MGRWGWAPPLSPHGHVKVAIYSKTPEGGEEEREGGGWRVAQQQGRTEKREDGRERERRGQEGKNKNKSSVQLEF